MIGGVAPVCERCEKTKRVYGTKPGNRAVPVAVYFNGQMLCPEHALEAMGEAGVTLFESFGCGHE